MHNKKLYFCATFLLTNILFGVTMDLSKRQQTTPKQKIKKIQKGG
jgi:hypothetical protein